MKNILNHIEEILGMVCLFPCVIHRYVFQVERANKTFRLIYEAFMATVKENMEKGEEVYLRGFGSFIIKRRAEKTARNIGANTTIIIPAHDAPAFKPAKEFMEMMKK